MMIKILKDKKGIALFMSIAVMAVFLFFLSASLYLTQIDSKVTSNFKLAAQALEVAEANYSGDGAGRNPSRVSQNSTEYRGRLPAWRVDFDDKAETTLYVAADNGDVVTRRNRIWRIYDFAWMLHIMDYRDRTDFNQPLLVWASVLAFVVALSGLYLVGITPWRSEARRLVKRK